MVKQYSQSPCESFPATEAAHARSRKPPNQPRIHTIYNYSGNRFKKFFLGEDGVTRLHLNNIHVYV